jgi:hypothetical protein
VQNAVIARGFNYTAQEQPSWDCDAGPWCYLVSRTCLPGPLLRWPSAAEEADASC